MAGSATSFPFGPTPAEIVATANATPLSESAVPAKLVRIGSMNKSPHVLAGTPRVTQLLPSGVLSKTDMVLCRICEAVVLVSDLAYVLFMDVCYFVWGLYATFLEAVFYFIDVLLLI